MSEHKPYKTRVLINESEENLNIKIPAKSNIFGIIILAVLTYIWTASGLALISIAYGIGISIFKDSFNILWFVTWSFLELYFAYCLFWLISGKEVINVNKEYIEVINDVVGFKTIDKYNIKDILNLRIKVKDPSLLSNYGFDFFDLKKTILFDYGYGSQGFGINLREPEANMVLKKIEPFMKNAVAAD